MVLGNIVTPEQKNRGPYILVCVENEKQLHFQFSPYKTQHGHQENYQCHLWMEVWNISNISPPSSLPRNAQWLLEEPPKPRILQVWFWWSLQFPTANGRHRRQYKRLQRWTKHSILCYAPSIPPNWGTTPFIATWCCFFPEWWPSPNHLRRRNCLILVENLQKAGTLPWDFMTWWRKLLDILLAFEEWEIKFCRRSENQVADNLSKYIHLVLRTFRDFIPPPAKQIYLEERRMAQKMQNDEEDWNLKARTKPRSDLECRNGHLILSVPLRCLEMATGSFVMRYSVMLCMTYTPFVWLKSLSDLLA